MALLATNTHTLINAASITGDFTATNRSAFTVSKGSTTYTATLDASQKQFANPIRGATSFAPVNRGWVAINPGAPGGGYILSFR